MLDTAQSISISQNQRGRFRPTTLVLSGNEERLLVGSSNGEIAVIDAGSNQVLTRSTVGKNISDICRGNQQNRFFAADTTNGKLLSLFLGENDQLVVDRRMDVCQFPTQLALNRKLGVLAITGHWSRQICFVQLVDSETHVFDTMDLGFVPGAIEWLNQDRGELIVADAFANQTQVVRVSKEANATNRFSVKTIVQRKIPDRRIGAFVSNGEEIVMATQMLNPLARSTRNDVHWGLMVSNDIESFQIEDYLSDQFNFSTDRRQQPIGGAGEAKSDPESIIVTPNKLMIVAMGGAQQIAVGQLDELGFAYLFVGMRPVDLAVDKQEQKCFVANQLDGSVSVVDLDELETVATIELDSHRVYSLEEQGERLFFDATLSHDGWMSCHSCHVEGHTNGLTNDNLSDDTFGTPKRVLSLLGHGDTEPMAWRGDSESLEKQVLQSLKVTMQADDAPSQQSIDALSAFVRSLPAPVSLDAARKNSNPAKIEAGRKLFFQLDCAKCHIPPTFTSPDQYEVGIEDEKGVSEFNPPSLIGLGQRDRFMHDGRFEELEEVFTKIAHQLPNRLSDEDLSDLMAFLKSL